MKPSKFSIVAIICTTMLMASVAWSQHEFPLLAEQNPFISYVIAQDDSLGVVRNHASETQSLAEAIRDYTDALANLDYSQCPEEFTTAFERHRKAWAKLIPFVEKYPDLRGEMHDLFDQLEKGPEAATFKPLVDDVRVTWQEVEKTMEAKE
jgi:hypothetical protein